jgi:hypothetical protein
MSYDPQNYAGGDGSSLASAVQILVENSSEGVAAEYAYLAHHFGNYAQISQALLEENERKFDAIQLELEDGRKLEIFFDITAFYGREMGDWLKDFLNE